MANQPSIDNVQRGLRVKRELDAKILKKFRVDVEGTKSSIRSERTKGHE